MQRERQINRQIDIPKAGIQFALENSALYFNLKIFVVKVQVFCKIMFTINVTMIAGNNLYYKYCIIERNKHMSMKSKEE